MADRPILFSAPMVRALLAGTKTQTRRALRIQPPANTVQVSTWHHQSPRPMFYAWARNGEPVADHATAGAEISDWPPAPCPYGQPGDRLWVREAWARTVVGLGTEMVVYREGDNRTDYGGPWKPSIHMPRAASRITLEVTGVRVERLQDISEADAIAEGIERSGECNWRDYMDHPHNDFTSARRSYRSLWEQINGAGAWDLNPWVWAVSFRRVTP